MLRFGRGARTLGACFARWHQQKDGRRVKIPPARIREEVRVTLYLLAHAPTLMHRLKKGLTMTGGISLALGNTMRPQSPWQPGSRRRAEKSRALAKRSPSKEKEPLLSYFLFAPRWKLGRELWFGCP